MGEIRFAPKTSGASQDVVMNMTTGGSASESSAAGSPSGWQGDLPRIKDATVFMSSPAPIRREIIAGVVHQGAMLSLGGASKMGKTWALLDMVVSVATGTPFWGFNTSQGKVLYINLELPEQDLHKRLFEICRAKGVNLPARTVALWNLRGCPGADITAIITNAILNFKPGSFSLIVIDPIYKCYKGRNENDAAQMTEMLEEIDVLAIKLNATVAFAAHFAKGNASGKNAIDRVSGSGVFARFPDTIVVATEHKLPYRYTIDIVTRSFPEQKPFVVKWEMPLMTVDAGTNPNDLATSSGSTIDRIAFIALLLLKPLKAGEWKYAALQAIGLNPNTFGTLRSEVITKGWVKGSDSEGGYSLTPKGMELVQDAKKASRPPVVGESPDQENPEEKDSDDPSPPSSPTSDDDFAWG